MLDQPDQLGRRAGANRGDARLHGGHRLVIGDEAVLNAPLDRRGARPVAGRAARVPAQISSVLNRR